MDLATFFHLRRRGAPRRRRCDPSTRPTQAPKSIGASRCAGERAPRERRRGPPGAAGRLGAHRARKRAGRCAAAAARVRHAAQGANDIHASCNCAVRAGGGVARRARQPGGLSGTQPAGRGFRSVAARAPRPAPRVTSPRRGLPHPTHAHASTWRGESAAWSACSVARRAAREDHLATTPWRPTAWRMLQGLGLGTVALPIGSNVRHIPLYGTTALKWGPGSARTSRPSPKARGALSAGLDVPRGCGAVAGGSLTLLPRALSSLVIRLTTQVPRLGA